MNSRLKVIQTSIFLVIGAILLAICALILINIDLTVKNNDWLVHSREINEHSERLFSHLKDIETGHRGYLITKDSLFLEPYFKSYTEVKVELAKLKQLTIENDQQQNRINELSRLLLIRVKLIDGNLKYFNSNGITNELIQRLKIGKKIMDSCRVYIGEIQTTENKLLIERTNTLQANIIHTQTSVFALFSLTIIFLFASYFLLNNLQKKKEENEGEIRNLNEELSVMVEELKSSNEEAYALNEELRSSNEELTTTNEKLDQTKSKLEKLNTNLEIKLSTFLENNLDLVTYGDESTNVEYLNSTGKKLLGYPNNDSSQNVFAKNHFSEEDFQFKIPSIQKFLKENGYWEGELNILSLEGKAIPFWIKTIAARNEVTGEIYHATIGRDLRIEKEAKAKLVENEERYRLLFENNPQPMWIYDFESRKILEANKAASEVYGYTKNEFTALTINELRPENEIEKLENHMKTVSSMEYSNISTWVHKTKSGDLMNVEIRSDGFELNGRVVRLVLSTDITSKLKNEENIRKVNSELIYQNEQLDKYVYVVSHNIRGPIASLLGLTNMLQYEEWSDTIAPVISNIHKVAERLDDVVKDLNKILSTKNNLNAAKEIVQLRVLINDIFEMINDQIEISGAVFVLNFEVEEIHTVRSYLHSIFLNLISNAIKYREISRPLQIEILVNRYDDDILIELTDNGMGIDLVKYKDKLFGLYKRFHMHVEGKGLGLHLIKSQVETLGGKINVTSELNKGTKFIIKLPITEKEV